MPRARKAAVADPPGEAPPAPEETQAIPGVDSAIIREQVEVHLVNSSVAGTAVNSVSTATAAPEAPATTKRGRKAKAKEKAAAKPKPQARQAPLPTCAQCGKLKGVTHPNDHKFKALAEGFEPSPELSGAMVLANGVVGSKLELPEGSPHYQVEDAVLAAMEIDDIAEQMRVVQGRVRLVGRELLVANAVLGQMLATIKNKMPTPDFFPWAFDQFHYSERHIWRLLFLNRNRDRVMQMIEENTEITLRGITDAINNKIRLDKANNPGADEHARLGEGAVPGVDPGESTWIYEADARDMPMGAGMVDLIVTSPPYGLGIEGVDASSGYSMYLEEVEVWAQEMFRVANNDFGRLCLNVPFDTFRDYPKCIFDDWLRSLERAGWQYRGMHLWDEGNVSKRTAWGSFRKPSAPVPIMPVECILVMFKGNWQRDSLFDYEPEVPSQEWRDWMTREWKFPGAKHPRHHAVYPLELPKRCILLYSYPGDIVLDPFVGVGTTSRAAKGLKRQSYGYDVNPEWVAEAQQAASEIEWGQILGSLGHDPGDRDNGTATEATADAQAATPA